MHKNEMTSRERVKAAVEFTGPDRIPHKHAYLPASFESFPGLIDLLKKFPSDFAGQDAQVPGGIQYKAGQWTDEWNCIWTSKRDGMLGQVTGHPLETLDDLKYYSWPDTGNTDMSGYADWLKTQKDRYIQLGSLNCFERMIALRGFENVMLDIAEGDPRLLEIRDRILKYNLDMIDRLVEFDIDAVGFADDWGSQISLLINPSAWRDVFLPVYKQMFERVRNTGKHVLFHSDGYTIEILPDIINAGASILWVDLTVNGLEEMGRKFGGKVCFQGLTDIQFTVRYCTVEDVEKHAKDLIRAFAVFNGGFISCSEIDPDQPWGNVVKILETFHKYSQYPISL